MTFLKGVMTSTLTAIALLAIVSFLLKTFGVSQVTLSPSLMQSHIDSLMPLEARGGFTLKQVRVGPNNGTINLQVKLASKRLGGLYELDMQAQSTLQYQPDKGQFFLEPQEINFEAIKAQTELNDTDESFLLNDAQESVKATLKSTPVYTLNESFKGYLVSKALESVEINDSGVVAHLSLWRLALALVNDLRS